jgi:hypothetical protein
MSPNDLKTEDPALAGAADFLTGFIPEEEYARRRGVTVRTCQRDRQLRKAPPYVQLGRQVFYRIDAVRDWLVKRERTDDLKLTGQGAAANWKARHRHGVRS